jgi:hypothetical protein
VIDCPKCNYVQPEREECTRCGFVFSEFWPPPGAPDGETKASDEEEDAPKWGGVWVAPVEEKAVAGAGTWVFRTVSLITILALFGVYTFTQSSRSNEAYVMVERFIRQDRVIFTDLVGRLGEVEVAMFFDSYVDEIGGTAQFTLPLSGRKGEGTLVAGLRRSRGVWDIERAVYTDRQGLQHSLIVPEEDLSGQTRGAIVQADWNSTAAPTLTTARAGPDPFIGWLRGVAGYSRAAELRSANPRPMVLYFHGPNDRYSRAFEEQFLRHPSVRSFLSGVLHVEVDPTSGESERTLAEDYGVTGFPTFLVVGADGSSTVVHAFYEGGAVSPEVFAEEVRRRLARL